MIEENQIVKKLTDDEPAKVTRIQKLGPMISVDFVGVNTSKSGNRMLSDEEFSALETVSREGTFNFTGDAKRFKLFTEAERISSAYQFDPLFAVNCSIVDPLPHQVEAVYKFLLPLPKIRFLLADDTGAGKTIMSGLLMKEMISRGFLEKILVITPGGLTKQWQLDELGVKFNLPFELADRAAFRSNPALFRTADRVVTSIDFIRAEDIINAIKDVRWDLIVVDEAHKLSAFDYGQKKYKSKRYEAILTLSELTDHLLLLTATPHRGRKDTFKNLLQLLDPDIFTSDDLVTSRINQLEKSGINKFFIRRLKEQMRDWNGVPLFKPRYTKTTQYELTPPEKKLYDAVTEYLEEKRRAASQQKNIHVQLTLMVMQRRLTSSIAAIHKTLHARYKALKGLLDELAKNPGLWKLKKAVIDLDVDSIADMDEMDDDERAQLDGILSDPRKFRMFTTADTIPEINDEAEQVRRLCDMADDLLGQDEQKLKELSKLLSSQGVLERDEKLVLFTEHRDTLEYLKQKLENNGYKVETIHGQKSVDERRQAQVEFAKTDGAQILLATDAAGEGINLQFCRLLINWDIPWNPNRLEQRMGRIHRYGQKRDVLVFNLVAMNTREGMVMNRLLGKLDIIRDQIGDDRVYDVISDVFENVSLDDVLKSTFDGDNTDYDKTIEKEFTEDNVRKKIEEQKSRLTHTSVDFATARALKETSDEKRLQPIYVRLFFEEAFSLLGGTYREVRKNIFIIETLPPPVAEQLNTSHRISADITKLKFCFDKEVFLDYQNVPDLGHVHYINPGNPVFDSLVQVVQQRFREDALRGTILISPDDNSEYLAWFVKSQIVDGRKKKDGESVADERLGMVYKDNEKWFLTSPAKYIDLKAPADFTKPITPPEPSEDKDVLDWTFSAVTMPQLYDAKNRVEQDAQQRREYLEESFSNVIFDINAEINDLQGQMLLGNNPNVERKISEKQAMVKKLFERRAFRLDQLEMIQKLSPRKPEILGCAYVVPLTQVEYRNHYGMSRDEDAEAVAMAKSMAYEKEQGWVPKDVSKQNEGYDIKSISPEYLKRYIEVKGRSEDGGVMLSENEMNRLAQLGDNAWLYIVTHCKSEPKLFRIQNPVKCLVFEKKSKGVQFFLHESEWKAKV
ncbi:helicase-related protein [Prosthecochloris sp. SCSIO W1103]|uniref:helicase-related protein n=1 Tax=Prosthecochloris sp. SCSIO W1103 TaxID=2992244 RepID=UPI00223D11B3|nr:helicase-related protein [Prosthecochloris sp. SCSIO W1103]UZJ38781.1 helicase-related protein [Prosthecochloris sp. SCSIO W1103]